MEEAVDCVIKHEEQKQGYEECSITIKSPDKLITKSLLLTIPSFGHYQTVNYLDLTNVRCDDVEEFEVFNISKNAQSIILQNCSLPPETLNHLIQQISHCNTISLIQTDLRPVSSFILTNQIAHLNLDDTKMSAKRVRKVCQQITHLSNLEYLHLSQINLAAIDLDLRNMRKLKWLDLSDTRMSREQCIDVFGQINNLPSLCDIDMSSNNLTRCLSSFLPDPHPGLPKLKWIYLKNTSLHTDDLLHLSNIMKLNKLPKLLKLDLSYNTLTGCISKLLPDCHQGFPRLYLLYLKSTALSKEDLQHFSNITRSNKLPKLQFLNLSQNTLSGCLSSIIPDPHQGLPALRGLYLQSTALNEEDLQHLTNIMRACKLPRLEAIHLDHALHKIKDELGQLTNVLQTCVDCHKTRLTISLKNNNLPAQFRKEMVEPCAGTLVHPIFKESESTKKISTDPVKAADDVSSGRNLFPVKLHFHQFNLINIKFHRHETMTNAFPCKVEI